MLKTHPQLVGFSRKLPKGAGNPGEDSPLLITPEAGREVQTGTPEVMENGGGTKQQAAEASGSQQPLNRQPRSVINVCLSICM